MLAGCWSPSSGLMGDWGEASSSETLVQRSEDASLSDGGQGHRGPGTTRLFPEGSGQGGAGGAGRAHSSWGRAVRETRFRDRDGAESRVHLSAEATAPAGPALPRRRARTPETRPRRPRPSAAVAHFRFPSRDRPARAGAGLRGRPGGAGSATQAPGERVAGAGSGSAPAAAETALCFRGRGHDSLGFRRRTCCQGGAAAVR